MVTPPNEVRTAVQAALAGPSTSRVVPAPGSSSHASPSFCRTLHPAEMFPLRPVERAENLACSRSLLAGAERAHSPLPPQPHGAIAPPGFGIYNLQMTYDAFDGEVILLGATGSGPLNGTQTWGFSFGRWFEINPGTGSPESCVGSALAYDSKDGYVVYFGGANSGPASNCSSANQTWTFFRGNWTHLYPTTSPPGRQAAAMTNDSADGYLILFGGTSASCGVTSVCNDTWKFVNGTWTELFPTTSPPARAGAGMAYDPSIGAVFMFGGTTVVGSLRSQYFWIDMLNDSWTFSGGDWQQLNTPGLTPPEPYDDGLVYDAADGYILYTNADNNASGRGGDTEFTWNFSQGAWTCLGYCSGVNPGFPPNRIAEGLAYDWADNYAVMFGGIDPTWTPLNDTFTFHAGTWTNLTARWPFAVTFSASPAVTDVGLAVLFNASVNGPSDIYTYSYVGLPPGCSSSNASLIGCIPTVAGVYSMVVSVTNSTGYTVNASATLVINPTLVIGSFTVSPARVPLGLTVQFGVNVTGGTAPYSFSYAGLPPGCSPSSLATFQCQPTQTGNFTVLVTVFDAVAEGRNLSVHLEVVNSPPPAPPYISLFAVTPTSVTLGGNVSFSVLATSVEPLTYVYRGLPTPCVTRNSSSWSCVPDTVGGFSISVIVTDPFGQSAAASAGLAVVPSAAGPAPLGVIGFFASPAVVETGGWTVLEVVADGGVAPYQYSYSGLPGSCASLSAASLPCAPAAPASYTITVTVTDSNGATARASTDLVVTPGSSGTTGSGGGGAASPTWLDLGLAALSAGLLGGIVGAVLLGRRPPPPKRE